MEAIEFIDDEVYAPEVSASGDNAFCMDLCSVVGHRPPYAACLHKIADRKNGRLATQNAECSAAIGKKECPAMKLRDKEVAAGKAIFFVNRIKLRLFNQYRAELDAQKTIATISKNARAPKAAPKAEVPEIKPAKPKPIEKDFLDQDMGTYADALNAAMFNLKSAKPAEPAKQKASDVPVQAGMSMLEMARIRLANQSQPQE